ncbi:hypothetical protein BHE74_00052678, partial [Ensete ventricosum]
TTNPPLPSSFQDKLLFLDSLGVDLFAAEAAKFLVVTPLADLCAIVDFLDTLGLVALEICCARGMCPEILLQP